MEKNLLKKTPENWPKSLIYTTTSLSSDLHPEIIKSYLSADDSDFISPILDKKEVHRFLEIKVLDSIGEHPLKNMKSPLGHEQRGVFAKNIIPKNTILGEYIGEITLKPTSYKISIPISPYCWTIQFPSFYLHIEAKKYANQLALVNDFHGIKKQPNTIANIIIHRKYYCFIYQTTKKINKNDEILIDYGKYFWQIFKK
jgi:hypothetical protein